MSRVSLPLLIIFCRFGVFLLYYNTYYIQTTLGPSHLAPTPPYCVREKNGVSQTKKIDRKITHMTLLNPRTIYIYTRVLPRHIIRFYIISRRASIFISSWHAINRKTCVNHPPRENNINIYIYADEVLGCICILQNAVFIVQTISIYQYTITNIYKFITQ